MARICSAGNPSFSPDDKWVSFITNISGAPQVWIMPAAGGYPRMLTNGEDPVTSQRWSPAGDWLAVTIAPGGGLNSQVYALRPDGTEMRCDAQCRSAHP
jgi:Tol biopolymer transport system component